MRSPPIIFLDIDGVLNGHKQQASGYCGIESKNALEFNRIMSACNPVIVITSAWRYLILNGSMTLKGFEAMLLSHGLCVEGKIIGCTERDPDYCSVPDENGNFPNPPRGEQILDWIKKNVGYGSLETFVVIDDLNLGITHESHPFILTEGSLGLTDHDADAIIFLLGRSKKAVNS